MHALYRVRAPRAPHYHTGFTLIEGLVATAIFAIVAVSVFQTFSKVFEITSLARLKVTATALANEQLEIARNLPYTDVGTTSGIPSGKIPRTQTLVRDGVSFTVTTTIRNTDDTFDGTIGGTPNDLSPADYKLVEVAIDCATCRNFRTLTFSASVGPKSLEGVSTNGALFIQVSDANGQPVSGAAVHITNSQTVPPITTDDTTNAQGLLQLVDVPPNANSYQITVSKSGYSTDKTSAPGAVENPNPTKPHATVAAKQVTQVSFGIDKTSTLNFASVTHNCVPVGNIDFMLGGAKIIGTNPTVLKLSTTTATDGTGFKTFSDLEWDTYTLALLDTAYDLAGSVPLLPLALNANTTQDVQLVVIPKNPQTLLVTVRDSGTNLPINDAIVTLTKTGYTKSITTGTNPLPPPEAPEGSTTTPPTCVPPGQVVFSGLSNSPSYTLTVTKDGYAPYTQTAFSISSPWQQKDVMLTQ